MRTGERDLAWLLNRKEQIESKISKGDISSRLIHGCKIELNEVEKEIEKLSVNSNNE